MPSPNQTDSQGHSTNHPPRPGSARRSRLAGLAFGLVVGGLAYWLRRRWLGRVLGLPEARYYQVRVQRNVRVPMRDGLTLATDCYFPVAPAGKAFPTILVRTPYERRLGFFHAQRFAERGYNVVAQDVRGRFGSDGEFEPFVNEQADGLDTLAWLRQQPWFNGVLGMWGSSYVAYVQWALAVTNPPELKAIVPVVATSRGADSAAPPGVIPFELLMRWVLMLDSLDSRGRRPLWQAMWRMLPPNRERILRAVFAHRPVIDVDELLLGEELPNLRDALRVPRPERYAQSDYGLQVGQVMAPANLVTGWYDIFLQDVLTDYASLRAAGRQPYLTIGPWHHMERGVGNEALRQAIGWYDRHLKGIPGRVRTYPVDVFVMGRNEWRSYAAWPPRAVATRFYLQPGGGLAVDLPRPGETSQADNADQYRYDPADPTPSLGGATFMNNAGSVDNRPVESRPDVLVYTSTPLETDLTVVGPVRLTLFVRSSRPYTDFYGRLCDVWPDGRSMNLCDGIIRLEPGQGDLQPDGSLRLELNLWATANCFLRGHAIRLQVSSGAYPRFDRNLGTGEPVVEGTTMYAADQTIYRDAAHPSALVLPVIGAGEAGG
jgi:hypothetical protein